MGHSSPLPNKFSFSIPATITSSETGQKNFTLFRLLCDGWYVSEIFKGALVKHLKYEFQTGLTRSHLYHCFKHGTHSFYIKS